MRCRKSATVWAQTPRRDHSMRCVMTDGSLPENFNWVRARSICSLPTVFKELEQGVRDDIETRQSLFHPSVPVRFTVASIGQRRFSVIRAVENSPTESVDFTLTNDGITAQDDEKAVCITASIALNDRGECRLKVGDEELNQWQFRKRALERMFFAPRGS